MQEELKETMRKSKEKKREKLEKLREAKRSREEAKRKQGTTTPRVPGKTANAKSPRVSPTATRPAARQRPAQRNLQNLRPTSRSPSNRALTKSPRSPRSPLGAKVNPLSIRDGVSIFLPPKPKLVKLKRKIQVDIESEPEQLPEEPPVKIEEKVEQKVEEVIEEPPVEEKEPEIPVLPQEELQEILQSEDFNNFVASSFTLMNQELEDQQNDNADFMQSLFDDKTHEDFDYKRNAKLVYSLQYEDEQRCVSSIQWSPHQADQLIASYTHKKQSDTAVGLILAWDLVDQTKPVQKFDAHSTITKTSFISTQTNLILGGTYNGQILIWDKRANHLPVQRSTNVSQGHIFPITGLKFVEAGLSSTIVSLSQDGRICTWQLGMMNNPMTTIENKTSPELGAHCFDLSVIDKRTYVIGTENGSLIYGDLSEPMDEPLDCIKSHFAFITSVSIHPHQELPLVLSSCVDWTVQVHKHYDPDPLFEFEVYNEYVYDIKWNPINPCIFACVDGEGKFDVWDLAKNQENPVIQYRDLQKAYAVLEWEESGFRTAIGSTSSGIEVFQIDKELASINADELAKMVKLIK